MQAQQRRKGHHWYSLLMLATIPEVNLDTEWVLLNSPIGFSLVSSY